MSANAAAGTALRIRDEKLLRDTIRTLAETIWAQRVPTGKHLWSIPVDQERDWDCILSDAIDELVAYRAAAALAGERQEPPPPQTPLLREDAAQLIADVLDEYREELTKDACDRCEQCGSVVMCGFHSVLSALDPNGAWTTGEIARNKRLKRPAAAAPMTPATITSTAPFDPHRQDVPLENAVDAPLTRETPTLPGPAERLAWLTVKEAETLLCYFDIDIDHANLQGVPMGEDYKIIWRRTRDVLRAVLEAAARG